MPDVVEQGGRPDGTSTVLGPRWKRRAVVGVVLLLIAGWAIRSGPLSGEKGDPAPRPTTSSTVGTGGPPALFVEGTQVVRYGDGRARTAVRLPPGPVTPPGWLPILGSSGRLSALGVLSGRVVRVTGERAVPVGPAERLVDTSRRAGQVYLQASADEGGDVIAVDVESTEVVDRRPFPGFDGGSGWSPQGVLSFFDADALLLSRPAGPGHDELAVAWAAGEVRSGRAKPLQLLGRRGVFVAATRDRAFVGDPSCLTAGCRLLAVSLGRGDAQVHAVRPPAGWSFATTAPPGWSRAPLALVQRHGTSALALVVAGGDTALLVPGSAGVVARTGLVQGPDGAVSFVRAGATGGRVLMTWDGARSSRAGAVRRLPSQSADARLVCLCG